MQHLSLPRNIKMEKLRVSLTLLRSSNGKRTKKSLVHFPPHASTNFGHHQQSEQTRPKLGSQPPARMWNIFRKMYIYFSFLPFFHQFSPPPPSSLLSSDGYLIKRRENVLLRMVDGLWVALAVGEECPGKEFFSPGGLDAHQTSGHK